MSKKAKAKSERKSNRSDDEMASAYPGSEADPDDPPTNRRGSSKVTGTLLVDIQDQKMVSFVAGPGRFAGLNSVHRGSV